ncbi:uncharacterized protein [Garra rufa]|uniref:uncharacterized protein n=1 Tax=Garra rufa TaxID=137080 RepID=UPI003CCE9E02
MEGDSVTLHTDVTELQRDNVILGTFGPQDTHIAKINSVHNKTFHDGVDERFRDRLKLDYQTGSLTMTNISTEHNGLYKVEIVNENKVSSKHFIAKIYGVFGANGVKSVSVMEGDSVTLNPDVTDIQRRDLTMWKFGQNIAQNILIAQINRNNNIFNDHADGRFRDRLNLDQTGSLTITNTRTTDSGLYKLYSKTETPLNTFNLTVYARLYVPVITRDSSQCSSSLSSSSSYCSLVCSVVNVNHVTLSWYKGSSLLSSISVSDLSISLSLPLEVEYQDNNTYSCVLNNPISNQTTHLNITQLCHICPELGLPLFYIVLISVAAGGSLLVVAAFGIFWMCRKQRKNDHKGKYFIIVETVQTCDKEITYADPTFYKRKAQKSRAKEEDGVVYAGVTVRSNS